MFHSGFVALNRCLPALVTIKPSIDEVFKSNDIKIEVVFTTCHIESQQRETISFCFKCIKRNYYQSLTLEPPDCCIICTVSIFRTSLYHDACLRMESEKSIHKNELLWAHELSGERGNNNNNIGSVYPNDLFLWTEFIGCC